MMFMPASHFSADYDGLKLLLLLARLVAKSEIISQNAKLQFRLDEGRFYCLCLSQYSFFSVLFTQVHLQLVWSPHVAVTELADMQRVLEESDMTAEQWAFGHDLNELMSSIHVEAKYFITVWFFTLNFADAPCISTCCNTAQGLEQCSVQVYHTLAAMYPEVRLISRHIFLLMWLIFFAFPFVCCNFIC